jgi:hypothetical protein
MDYKTKYLKYKTKYFNLKNEMEGGYFIVKGAQFLGREAKKIIKGTEVIQQEITEISDIVEKLKGHPHYPHDISGNKINVESFLKFIKRLRDNFNTEKIGKKKLSSIVTLANLNLIYGKHYLCKTNQRSEFYDNTNCKLNKQINT